MASAAVLFDQAGYHRTSMEDIARAVGIRKPTLYHYVTGKDEILFWIHEAFIDLLIARHEVRQRTQMSMSQNLSEIMGDLLDLMDDHRSHVRVFFEHYRELPAKYQTTIKQKRDRYQSMVEDVIRQGVQSGAFRSLDPRLATLALFGMCNWAYQWYRKGGSLRSREIAYVFWDLLLRGIQAQPSGSMDSGSSAEELRGSPG